MFKAGDRVRIKPEFFGPMSTIYRIDINCIFTIKAVSTAGDYTYVTTDVIGDALYAHVFELAPSKKSHRPRYANWEFA